MAKRRAPYVWVTWLTGLLSGDKQCEWALWFKANYRYEKRLAKNAGQLAQWTAVHSEMVKARAAQLRIDGWNVMLEGQNKFQIEGTSVTVGGQSDIVASKDGDWRVEECKTGMRRHSDVWQVLVYMALLPVARPLLRGLTGEVRYVDGSVMVRPEPGTNDRIFAQLKGLSGQEPVRTPSASECAYCDIVECSDRIDEPDSVVSTGVF